MTNKLIFILTASFVLARAYPASAEGSDSVNIFEAEATGDEAVSTTRREFDALIDKMTLFSDAADAGTAMDRLHNLGSRLDADKEIALKKGYYKLKKFPLPKMAENFLEAVVKNCDATLYTAIMVDGLKAKKRFSQSDISKLRDILKTSESSEAFLNNAREISWNFKGRQISSDDFGNLMFASLPEGFIGGLTNFGGISIDAPRFWAIFASIYATSPKRIPDAVNTVGRGDISLTPSAAEGSRQQSLESIVDWLGKIKDSKFFGSLIFYGDLHSLPIPDLPGSQIEIDGKAGQIWVHRADRRLLIEAFERILFNHFKESPALKLGSDAPHLLNQLVKTSTAFQSMHRQVLDIQSLPTTNIDDARYIQVTETDMARNLRQKFRFNLIDLVWPIFVGPVATVAVESAFSSGPVTNTTFLTSVVASTILSPVIVVGCNKFLRSLSIKRAKAMGQ